jgi:hypothetical protein
MNQEKQKLAADRLQESLFGQRTGHTSTAPFVVISGSLATNSDVPVTAKCIASRAYSIWPNGIKHFKNRGLRSARSLGIKLHSRPYKYCVKCYLKRSIRNAHATHPHLQLHTRGAA